MRYYFIVLAAMVPIAVAIWWNSMQECQTEFSFWTCYFMLSGR